MSPLFEYVCPECGATQERLEPFDAPKPICQACRDAAMERKPSAGSFKIARGKGE